METNENQKNDAFAPNAEKKKQFTEVERKIRFDEFKSCSENSKQFYIAMIIGIVLSLLIVGVGAALAMKSAKALAAVLAGFGVFSGLSFAFGIYACNKYSAKCDEFVQNWETADPEEIDQSTERLMINVALYLMMILLLVFLLLSIACFAFKDEIKFEIKAIAQSQTKWKTYFGDYSYDQVSKYASVLITVLGVIAIVLAIFIGVVLFFAFKVLGSYRTWQTVIQFICVVFFILGLCFLYLSIYAQRYRDVSKVDKAMPAWVPDALLGIAAVSIVLAIFGFLASFYENLKFLTIFKYVIAVFTVLILVIAGFGVAYSGKFKSYFETRCASILDFINEDYLKKYAGCDSKYIFTTENLDKMVCPKDRIVTAWESNLFKDVDEQKDVYGCIDKSCCYQTYSFIKSKSDYMALIAFALFIFGVLLFIGSYYMCSHLELGIETGASMGKFQYGMGVAVLVVIIIMGVLIGMIPAPPTPSPVTTAVVEAAPVVNTQVSSNIVIQPDINKVTEAENKEKSEEIVKQTDVKEDKSKCTGNCLKLKYFYELSSNDGVFTRLFNDTTMTILRDERRGSGWYVNFASSSGFLSNFTEYFLFTHNCPLNPSSIHATVRAVAFDPKKPEPDQPARSFLQLKSKSRKLKIKQDANLQISASIETPTVDFSKLTEGQTLSLVDKELDYSFVKKDSYQIISGQVYQATDSKSAVPLKGAVVEVIPLDFGQCDILKYTTNEFGGFESERLYVLDNDIQTKYRLEIRAEGLDSYVVRLTMGGLGWIKNLDQGQIIMWPSNFVEKSKIGSMIINSINNERLPEAKVSIWMGYKDFNNEVAESNKATSSFLQLRQQVEVTPNVSNVNDIAPPSSNSNTSGQSQIDALVEPKFVSSTQSDAQGQFSFESLDPSTYTLVFEKEGFYREIYYLDVAGALTKPLLTIQMTPLVDDGKIRFVLSWPSGPKDVDIHSFFKISRFSKCEVYFGKRDCVGTGLDTDNFNGGSNGVETITINSLGKYIYTFAVHKYVDNSNGQAEADRPMPGSEDTTTTESGRAENANVPDLPLTQSKAKVSVYVSGYKGSIYQLEVPSFKDENTLEVNLNESDYTWWWTFCLDGNAGVNSIRVVNKLTSNKPTFTSCENLYKK